MADEAIAAGRAAPHRSNTDLRANREQSHREVASGICWFPLLLFVFLQIADVITTNCALAMPGIKEANPLMMWMQTQLGTVWWLPKVAVVAFVCVATPLLRRRWPMLLVIAYYSMAVSINIANL